MKTKLMLIGLMMCVVGAPLWADPVVAVTVSSGPLVDQVIDLDVVGPEGWVALALQEPNSTTSEWEWVGPTVFDGSTPTERTNVRPAMYKTKNASKITFNDYTMLDKRQSPAVPGDPTLWRTHSEPSYVNNTYWKWTENSSTVEYKEYEYPTGGDKRFRTYSAVAGPQQLLYDFIVTPVAVGAQHAVEAWFNLRLNGNTRYEFFVNDTKAGEYAPTNNPGNGYYQATLKIFPDSMDTLKVTVAFESMKPTNTADRGGVFGAALKVSYTAIVVGQPVSQTVEIGSEAEFSITAGNATTYQWFKEGTTTPITNGTQASGAVISGAQTATLTITNVQVADEGYYYCEVDNDLATPDTSDSARLLTQRLVGWWKLDNNDPNDSVQDRYPAAPSFGGQTSGDPNYVAGIDGEAIELSGASGGEIVNMPGSSGFYNFYPQGYTVSAWVKAPPEAGRTTWRAFVSKMYCWEISSAANMYGYALMHDLDGNAVFVQRRNMGNLGSNVKIDNNEWYFVIGTWNPSTMRGSIYVNGILRAESGVQTQLPALPPADSDLELSIVRIGADGDRYAGELNAPFIGLVDDVRIYSYPLSPSQVYYLYSELVPGAPTECVEFNEFDVTGPAGVPDCIVNLYDFAVFAEAWQECFIVPDCL